LNTSNDEINDLIDNIFLCEDIGSFKEERKQIRIILEGALILAISPSPYILANLFSENFAVVSDLLLLASEADRLGHERLGEPVERVRQPQAVGQDHLVKALLEGYVQLD